MSAPFRSLTFACDVEIEAPIGWVYDTLTAAQGLSLWWRKRIVSDLRGGSTVDLRLGAACVMRIRVDGLEQHALLAWTCVGGVPEWELSTLRFELLDVGSTTLLSFTHHGWRGRAPGGELWSCDFSWPHQLIRLRVRSPHEGRNGLALYRAANERLYARKMIRSPRAVSTA